MDRIRAERVLDAAQSATFPHLTKRGAREWLAQWMKRTAAYVASALTLNGRPVTGRRLRQAMEAMEAREALGTDRAGGRGIAPTRRGITGSR